MRATRKCHYLLIRLSYSVIQIGVTAFFSSKQLFLFARPKQTAVTAQFSSKHLPSFACVRQYNG